MRSVLITAACVASLACQSKPAATGPRAELRRVGPAAFEVYPAEGQLPHCLVFTHSAKGVIRQLTMTHENESLPCPAGQKVAGIKFWVPVDEGKVEALVFFSDQKLNAGSIAQQLYERARQEKFSALELRAPGNLYVQSLEFVPETDPNAPAPVPNGVGGSGADAG